MNMYQGLKRGHEFGEPYDGLDLNDLEPHERVEALIVRAGLGETYENRKWMDEPGGEVDRAVDGARAWLAQTAGPGETYTFGDLRDAVSLVANCL